MSASRQNRRPMGTPVTEADRAQFAKMRENMGLRPQTPPPIEQPARARVPEGYKLPEINLPPEVAATIQNYPNAPPNNGPTPLVVGHGTGLPNGPIPQAPPAYRTDLGPIPEIPNIDTRTLKPDSKAFVRDPGFVSAMARRQKTRVVPKSDIMGLRVESKRPPDLSQEYQKFFPYSDNFWYPPDTQIWVRPLTVGDLSAFSKALATDNNTLLLDAMGATIKGIDIRDLVPEDYHGLVIWHRFHSLPRTPVSFKYDSIYGARNQSALMEQPMMKETSIRTAMKDVRAFEELRAKGIRQRTIGDVESLTNLALAAGTPGFEWVDESVLWEAEMATHLDPKMIEEYEIELPAEQEAFASLFQRVAIIDTMTAELFVDIQRIQSLEYGVSETVDVRLDYKKMPPLEKVRESLESIRDRMDPEEKMHQRAVAELERLTKCLEANQPFFPEDEEVSLPITARAFFPAVY